MKILNATPHVINIFRKEDVNYDEKLRKYFLINPEQKSYMEIQPCGILLNVETKLELKQVINGIPIFEVIPVKIDKIPAKHDIVIVSNMYANYALQFQIPNIEKLYTISQPVYISRENPRPIGCLGLNKVISAHQEM